MSNDSEKLISKISKNSIDKRWESGDNHHPKSVKLFNLIRAVDDRCNDGSFDWKAGGDGDNGESLMYCLDEIFERDLF